MAKKKTQKTAARDLTIDSVKEEATTPLSKTIAPFSKAQVNNFNIKTDFKR